MNGLTRQATPWTRLPNTRRPRAYLEGQRVLQLPNGQAQTAPSYAWRCETHERSMSGYPTLADAVDAATHHSARRH